MTKKINYLISFMNRPCDIVVDIGCDHGYLGLTLLKNHDVNLVINIDKKSEPLQSAIKNLTKYNLKKQTINLINDGLNDLNLKMKIDYVVIAGLGAQNIIKILKKKQANNIKYFLFQPEGNLVVLRRWLFENNYEILNEGIIKVDEHFYVVILCNENKNYQKAVYGLDDLYLGPILKFWPKNLVFREWVINQVSKYEKITEKCQSEKNLSILRVYYNFLKDETNQN
ncbi:class I SAM-dependent methyltransferase [Mycoplasma amphoriforme]